MIAVTELMRAAECQGRDLLAEIDQTTEKLSRLMAAAHGGEWRTQIEHEHQFVIIARRLRK